MTAWTKFLGRAADTLAAAWAFVDAAVVVAVPIAVVVLAWRGRPLWKSHVLVVLPYMLYATLAGRMPYLTAYVVIGACQVPGWYLGVHGLHCQNFWQSWVVAAVVVGPAPALLLAGGRAVRRRLGSPG